MGKPTRRPYGCQKHCIIWWYRDGVMYRGCGHCSVVSSKTVDPVGDPEYLALQAQRSREGHQVICGRPIR